MPIRLGYQSDEERNRGQSRLMLEAMIEIVMRRSSYEIEQQHTLIGRFYNSTEATMQGMRPDQAAYRKLFVRALGEQEATRFLTEFNAAVIELKKDLKKKPNALLRFSEAEKRHIVASLTTLKEATAHYGGFFIPSPGSLHPRVNTHLCTGR